MAVKNILKNYKKAFVLPGLDVKNNVRKGKSTLGLVACLISFIIVACPLTEISNSLIDSFRRLISGIHF